MNDMSRKLQFMLCDLESNQLQTVLAPSKRHDRREWDCVRVNISVNPLWYHRLCANNISKRGTRKGKADTIIRRQHVLSALNRLIYGMAVGGRYEERILDVARGIKL